MEVGERSVVGRNFITKACPPAKVIFLNIYPHADILNKRIGIPIAFADPGSIKLVVTPPAMARAYASS